MADTGSGGMLAGFGNGLGVPLLLLVMLAMMMVPLPPLGLDVLFTFNIALSVAILLTTIYVARPLEFAVFPSILLVVTLLRLALNIASTRVVLLNGHTGTGAAGKVIEAFGEFVIGGNYAVGFVIFCILVIINFVVVTKGAGRVSEVTARFTLDAMPGKQMAIDADLNAGIINDATAKERRREISDEADFYGSMDGASKFVRGDAVASILILFINIIGGLIIGSVQHGLSLEAAIHNYTLLTIGDGLVAQMPSLLLSTAVAIIVTRVSSSQDMGNQVLSQLFNDSRTLTITAGVMAALGLVPGMPNFAFLLLAAVCGFAAWRMRKRPRVEARLETEESTEPAPLPELGWDDVGPLDQIGLEVGYRLIPLVDRQQEGPLVGRIKGVRKKLSEELGFLIPAVHIRDNLDLGPNLYRILIMGVPVGEFEVFVDKELAINPGQVFGSVKGAETKEPAYGMDAYWIEPAQHDEAQMLGYTVVDAATVVATHLSQLLQDHAYELIGHEETQHMLDRLAESAPKLVEELAPKILPTSTITRVLRNLLEEKIPVRNFRRIAETLAEFGVRSQEPDALAAAVRVRLGRSIVQNLAGMRSELNVLTLEPELERILNESTQDGASLGIEPGIIERLQQSLKDQAQRHEVTGDPALLLVAPPLRPWLARMMKNIRNLTVLAYDEIPDDRSIQIAATVG